MKQLLLFLLVGFSVYGQQMHHQMVSAQGGINLVSYGLLIKQTVGQQSVVGNYNLSTTIFGQGFQQSSFRYSRGIFQKKTVITKVYPNPFVDQIQFIFSEPLNEPIFISIFDMLGRLVYSDSKTAINSILSVDNLHFAENQYLVQLVTTNYIFATQIIKIK